MNRLIIDVREPIEFHMGHVQGAINIPSSRLASASEALRDIPHDTQLVLYCRSGSRAGAAMVAFHKLGYTKVVNGINKDNVKANHT